MIYILTIKPTHKNKANTVVITKLVISITLFISIFTSQGAVFKNFNYFLMKGYLLLNFSVPISIVRH